MAHTCPKFIEVPTFRFHWLILSCLSFILKDLGCRTTLANKEVVEYADVVFLAVKPHLIVPVIQEIKSSFDSSKHLVVSVAAAITTDVIEGVSYSSIFAMPRQIG